MLKTVTLAVSIYNELDNPIYGETVTHVRLEDEAAGAYISISQCKDIGTQSVQLSIDELRTVMSVAEKLMEQTKDWR